MKFELHTYQRNAVEKVLENLERARSAFHRGGENSSFSLTATTGAGKTVMAAAAIEALFYGNSELLDGFEADPNAVVLWFSDDPALNLQTRDRLMQASEAFSITDLVVIEPPFSKPKLDPGKVYFLNTQKLSKTSMLTRGHVEDVDDEQIAGLQTTPDMQGWTIWETISNTIDDEDLTVYLILDEAHRGFNGKTTSGKPTIVKKLVNGHAGYRPMPIVWGISATIERFDSAMKEAQANKNRLSLPRVLVDPGLVQASGLVKDTIALTIPDERGGSDGGFDITLVRHGAERLQASAARWAKYAAQEGETEAVVPLLILQTPNTPDEEEVGHALDAISETLGGLSSREVRHVFGDHKPLTFGSWEIDHIPPQRVEKTREVRVLVAKDAISTGWDCPRAEVMVSFRPAKDQTHITQLLGRMVRSPLARRVPGDERLNAVDCVLPRFDRTTAGNVVKYLTGQIEEMPGGPQKRIMIDGRDLVPNPEIPDSVWDLWVKLPTETMPQRGARPVTRLIALAYTLSADSLRPGAIQQVKDHLFPMLDRLSEKYVGELDAAVQEIWDVHLKELLGKVGGSHITYNDVVIRADDRAIRTGLNFAKQAFGAEIAMGYVDHLADQQDDDDSLREAYVKTAALAAMKDVRTRLDNAANTLTNQWFDEHQDQIKKLLDERQQAYETIRSLATEPETGWLSRPRNRMEDFAIVDKETGDVGAAPIRRKHLMSDENGDFPVHVLNPWEIKVIDEEMARPGALGWYRNPSRPALDSVTIAYRDGEGNWHSMHPDFVFFHEIDGEVKASIIDPHGHHLDDARMKLEALSQFADRYAGAFDRIEQISQFGNVMRSIPMHLVYAREGLKQRGRSVVEFYHADFAVEYAKHSGQGS